MSLCWLFMTKPVCPMCETNEILEHAERNECVTCGHEWERAPEPEAPAGPRVVKDAHGNALADGDCVILIKDLKLGGSEVLKGGSKSKPIRIVDGDHEISCKVDGIAVGLKACFVKKA
jgi:protein PhnA